MNIKLTAEFGDLKIKLELTKVALILIFLIIL